MAKQVRKTIPMPPRNAWEAQVERMEGDDPSQAGEFDSGLEEGDAGGDKGIDADTGSGGYSGDIVERGVDDAEGEPERPLDAEITGDPRTRAGEPYPEEMKRADEHQPTVSRAAEELDET
jgi:hypothetical protein